MNDVYRPLSGLNKKKQGFVRFAMLNQHLIKHNVVTALEKAMRSVCNCDMDYDMLKEYITSDHSTIHIASKYFCCSRKLEILYKKYMTKAVEIITNI